MSAWSPLTLVIPSTPQTELLISHTSSKTFSLSIRSSHAARYRDWSYDNDSDTLELLRQINVLSPYMVYGKESLKPDSTNYFQWEIIPLKSDLTNPSPQTLLNYNASSSRVFKYGKQTELAQKIYYELLKTSQTQPGQVEHYTEMSSVPNISTTSDCRQIEHHQIFSHSYARNYQEVWRSAFKLVSASMKGQMETAYTLDWTTAHCFLHFQVAPDSAQRSCFVAELVFTK